MGQVVLRNVDKHYGGFHAVKSVNLSFEDGEFIVLVGPSGCGKSTTLRMIAGLEEVTSGEITIGDRDVTHLEPRGRDVAMVFQNYALYPHKTIYKNLSFGLTMAKVPAAEIDRRVRWAAGMLGIEALLDRKPKQLSGGQMQRVALGRAMVREPSVFLLDEPLSNLDAKLRVRMREEIANLHRRIRTSMIYVTHDQVEAMTLGDRIVVMKDGEVQQVGAPLEVYDRPANRFVASFIGSPEMNFVEGEIREDAGLRRFHHAAFSLPIPAGRLDSVATGKPVTLGIRPEHISFTGSGGIPAAIVLVEQMGAQTVAAIDVGGQSLRAVVDRDDTIRIDDTRHIDIPPEKMHFFDAAGGQAL